MDKALKQRLVGASVLIILTVIVLPMLLSGRSDPLQQGSPQIEIPQKPEEVSISKRRFPVGIPDKPIAAADVPEDQRVSTELIEDVEQQGEAITDLEPDIDGEVATGDYDDTISDLVDSTGQRPAPNDDLTDVAQSDNSQAPEIADAVPEEAPTVTKVVVEPEPVVDMAPIEDSDNTPRYLVQVASFSSEKRADALAADLRGAGMKVEVDVVERNGGRLHRVRVGPYAGRSDADAAVAKIKAGSKGLSPRVMDLRPGDAAPVSTPSDPLVRWVVQVGSFSSSDSAEAQVAQLRLAGLPAFSEKITSSGGSVYKVRVGPEINRDKATELARRIKKEQNLEGFVTTQE